MKLKFFLLSELRSHAHMSPICALAMCASTLVRCEYHSLTYIFNVLLFGWKRKLIMKLLVWFLCAHTELLTVNRVKEERYSYPTTTVEKQLSTASNYYLRAIFNWFSRIVSAAAVYTYRKKTSQTVKIENTCFSCCLSAAALVPPRLELKHFFRFGIIFFNWHLKMSVKINLYSVRYLEREGKK